MILRIDGNEIAPRPDETLLEIIKELGLDSDSLKARPLAADIAGEVFTLNYVPVRSTDERPAAPTTFAMRRAIRRSRGDIKLIRYAESRGKAVYERTLLFVFFLAVRSLWPDAEVKVKHAIGAGLYITIKKDSPLTAEDVELLHSECGRTVNADYVLERKRLDIDEAIELFERDGQEDKVRLLKWRRFTYFDIYRHGDYADYFYGEMCPSTGYVRVFDLQFHDDGLLLLRPDNSDYDMPAPHVDSPKFFAVFHESDRWGELMSCTCIADLNDLVASGEIRELIRVNEALHEKRFAELANEVSARNAKVLLIAGPSSSGKTTSANRMATQLRVLAKKPILLSLDDYYLDRSLVQPEPDGSFDFEHIKMIDVQGFNRDLEAMLKGETVEIPNFNFKTGQREMLGHYVHMDDNSILIIEGLHALNPALLTPSIDHGSVFRLFVSALTTLNYDDHNRIPTAEVRLLRRMVRDFETRGSSPERTLNMWASVRAGEERWIFPYQEGADAILNTALVYELAELKKHIFPILETVSPENPCYWETISIIKFLNYVQDAAVEDEIPPTSILREFVGGNAFYRS